MECRHKSEQSSNLRKHGVSYKTATEVFDDPMHAMILDRVVDGEVRWKTLGEVQGRTLLLVIHTLDEEGEEVVRIISAREATPHERREYEKDL